MIYVWLTAWSFVNIHREGKYKNYKKLKKESQGCNPDCAWEVVDSGHEEDPDDDGKVGEEAAHPGGEEPGEPELSEEVILVHERADSSKYGAAHTLLKKPTLLNMALLRKNCTEVCNLITIKKLGNSMGWGVERSL